MVSDRRMCVCVCAGVRWARQCGENHCAPTTGQFTSLSADIQRVLTVGMIIAGYLGATALVPTVRWMWFVIALILYGLVLYAILREFRQTVIDRNDVLRIELYSRVSLVVLIVWSIYPFVWMLGEGTGLLGVSVEVILYCILDLLSKVVFCFLVINHSGPYASEPVPFSNTAQAVQYERQYV